MFTVHYLGHLLQEDSVFSFYFGESLLHESLFLEVSIAIVQLLYLSRFQGALNFSDLLIVLLEL